MFDELIKVVDDPSVPSVKPSHQKRALWLFVISVLSDLFGTAKHDNLGKLKYLIEKLQDSETDLIHMVRDKCTTIK